MKRREQALLFLRKAAQDESLLDAVLECPSVSDELIGFHCQQLFKHLPSTSQQERNHRSPTGVQALRVWTLKRHDVIMASWH